MEKKKQSKKRWAWTEKHVRKHAVTRSKGNWYTIPKWYTRYLHRENKTLERRRVQEYMRDNFEKDVELKHKYGSAGYHYW